MTREKLRGVPYLSVVVPALPGGDALLDAFARHAYNASRSAHLDVEVLAVDCTPSFNTRPFEEHNISRDLPLSQRFAWLPSHPLGDFHVVSWAKSGDACQWDAVGMHNARGTHVLFTNSSMRFPIALLEQIAHRRLPHRPMHVHTLALGGDVLECSAALSNLGTCIAGDEARCLMPESEQERLSRSAGLTGAHGELLIVPKAGISSANDKVAEGAFMDSAACFVQVEASNGVINGRPQPAPSMVANPTSSYAGLIFALVRPEDAAYNPEEPLRSFAHSPLFKRFRPFWSGSFDSSWVVDFLGTHTAYEYDCENIERYRIWHLSRRIPCARHDLFRSTGVTDVVLGELPIVDEEYFEWLALLRAVTRFADFKTPEKRPFAVVEFGARYGTWAVRGGMAARRLLPDHPTQLLAVEADQTCHRWLLKHLKVNGFDTSAALRGFVSEKDGTAAFSAWEKDSPTTEMVPSFSAAHLLANFTVVDIIHCDIQGAESAFLQEATLSVLQTKVKSIHFGTHGTDLHDQLVATFTSRGWIVVENMQFGGGKMPGRPETTAHGQIRILWDGMLTVENPALADD